MESLSGGPEKARAMHRDTSQDQTGVRGPESGDGVQDGHATTGMVDDGHQEGRVGGRTARVLCVDEQALVVEGLRAHLVTEAGIEVVGRISSAEEMSEAVDRFEADLVVLDIELPCKDVFAALTRLRSERPRVKVMVLTSNVRDASIALAHAAGASAYFAKTDPVEDIVRGIHHVAASDDAPFLIGSKVRERCLAFGGGGDSQAYRGVGGGLGVGVSGGVVKRRGEWGGGVVPRTLLDSLTVREREILRLIGRGRSRAQIADDLGRSVKTIDAHQSRMMRKLGIDARADLIRYAIHEGLAEA